MIISCLEYNNDAAERNLEIIVDFTLKTWNISLHPIGLSWKLVF